MSLVLHVLRLVVGIALVAGGVVLAQPFAAVVLAARQQSAAPVPGRLPLNMQTSGFPSDMPSQGSALHMLPNQPFTAVAAPPQVDAGVLPPGRWPADPEPTPAVAAASSMPGVTGVPPGNAGFGGMNAVMPPSRVPPPPPAPLPRSAAEFAPVPPPLDGAYRSTLDIPPPPLLDTQSPPPLAVGWSANDVPRSQPSTVGDAVQPPTYVVRDGDDLTGIALRVYGSAGAASAIWAANRDRLQDPQLLPIGMVLKMPPSWTLPSAHAAQGAGQAIEPTFGTAPSAASWRTARPSSTDPRAGENSAWLQPGQGGGGRYQVDPPQESRNGPPATVRVAAGDSLESIAVRYYGDRTAAARLWQANKDRLRSPDLLVPGTELRLP